MLTGDEIRGRLSAFAARWATYDRGERGEAQTFLNELFECYGTKRREVAEFEAPQAGRFLDLLWPGVCLIEMKAPSEVRRLAHHREQALRYWEDASDPERNVASPPYVVLCAFHRLEIWEPGRFPKQPRLTLDLAELSDAYDALLFLVGREPVFEGGQATVTPEAVTKVTELARSLAERRCGGPDERRDFILQSVWCLFAEDLGQIPGHRFTGIVDDLGRDGRRSSADDLGGLFTTLNDPSAERPAAGLYQGVPYANGGLFARPARLHLQPRSWACCARRATSTGATSNRRYSARCSKARSATTSNGSSAPTTRTTRSCRRSSSPRSCAPGGSASPRSPPCARRKRLRTN